MSNKRTSKAFFETGSHSSNLLKYFNKRKILIFRIYISVTITLTVSVTLSLSA